MQHSSTSALGPRPFRLWRTRNGATNGLYALPAEAGAAVAVTLGLQGHVSRLAAAGRRRLDLLALEQQSRWVLEREGHVSLETLGRYSVARQWYTVQKAVVT